MTFKLLTEQLEVQFLQLWPFVAVRSWDAAVVRCRLHRAKKLLVLEDVWHLDADQFGPNDFQIEFRVVADHSISFCNVRRKGRQDVPDRFAFYLGFLMGDLVNVQSFESRSPAVWFDDVIVRDIPIASVNVPCDRYDSRPVVDG